MCKERKVIKEMETKIVVPSLGESVIEATVLQWLKKTGERVKVGEPLVELETDKVNLEVSADRDGVLLSQARAEQEDVRVGDVLGTIGDVPAGNGQKPAAPPSEAARPESRKPEPAPEVHPEEKAEKPAAPERIETGTGGQKEEKITPVARRFAEEKGIDLTKVEEGSGPQGRITRHDLESLIEKNELPVSQPPVEPAPPPVIQPVKPEPRPVPSPIPEYRDDEREERIHMSRRRRTIARNLIDAQQNAALLTTFNDLDLGAIMEIRKARKEAFKQKFGVSLGIVSFFVKASILALKDFPRLNAEVQDDDIVLKYYYDIGVAIGAEEGLVVPVLRDADRMSFGLVERSIQGFAQKVKDGSLSLEDIRGGTFTITNGGVFGSLLSTPIVNAPEVGILGLHRIEDRPVARNGNIVLRPMMYAALTYDHRIVDGREAVQFLVRIKEVIENPEMMLLEL